MAMTQSNREACEVPLGEPDSKPPSPKMLTNKFNFWTGFAIAVVCSGAWEGWVASLAQGILAGGPVTLLYGWIVASVGVAFISCSMAEMVSIWPSAGGQYVWVAKCMPNNLGRLLSWYTAWFSFAGLWLGAVSSAMGVAVQVQAYVSIARPYDFQRWQAFLIVILVIGLWVLINIYSTRLMHYMNHFIIVVHVTFFLIIIIVLAVCTKQKHDASYVFTGFENYTGWESDGVAWCVGLLTALFGYFSLATASNFSEEIPNPEIQVPRAMVTQIALNSVITTPFIITVLFCIGDALQVLESNVGLISPFTQVVLNSTNSVTASIILNAANTSVAFVSGLDLWGAAARAMWSLARDNALPPIFARLDPTYEVPVVCILAPFPPAILITMIYIWNSTAFYGIMAGVVVSFQLSYAIPIGARLFYSRRYHPQERPRWNLGRFGVVVDSLSFGFGIFFIIFLFFPAYMPVTAVNMNYSIVLISALMVFATIVWYLYTGQRYLVIQEQVLGTSPESLATTAEEDVKEAFEKEDELHKG